MLVLKPRSRACSHLRLAVLASALSEGLLRPTLVWASLQSSVLSSTAYLGPFGVQDGEQAEVSSRLQAQEGELAQLDRRDAQGRDAIRATEVRGTRHEARPGQERSGGHRAEL
jgi:hypothetical protein